jgi:hypothetical protein
MLRDQIWNTYEVGQEADPRLVSPEYRQAAEAARSWVQSFLAANDPSV